MPWPFREAWWNVIPAWLGESFVVLDRASGADRRLASNWEIAGVQWPAARHLAWRPGVVGSADLGAGVAGPGVLSAGEDVVDVTFTVTNSGGCVGTLAGVVALDGLELLEGVASDGSFDRPTGRWAVDEVGPGASVTLELTGWVTAAAGEDVGVSLTAGAPFAADATDDNVAAWSGVAPERVPSFVDVGPASPFFLDVEWLHQVGVAEGWADGSFRPASVVTRQAAVAWWWRLAGSPAPTGSVPFWDVDPEGPFADAVAWAAEEGLVAGWPDGSFRGGLGLSRQAFVTLLWRRAGAPCASGGCWEAPFSDVSSASPFAAAIQWAAGAGVAQGWPDGTFRPTAPVTRQSAAAWFHRADGLGLLD